LSRTQPVRRTLQELEARSRKAFTKTYTESEIAKKYTTLSKDVKSVNMAPGTDVQSIPARDPILAVNTLAEKQALINITAVPSTPETPTPATENDIALVLDPTLITQEFDLLRFHAAAYTQLPGPNSPAATKYSTLLISSPYNTPAHHLDLSTLPTPSLLFAKALTALAPTTPSYATEPYISALNFDHVLSVLRDLVPANYVFPASSFYVVVFRSKLKPDIDNDRLYLLDYESHREACESGGLLKYWFGKADGERRNLATCKCCSSLLLHISLHMFPWERAQLD
jgi:hypothetical protein